MKTIQQVIQEYSKDFTFKVSAEAVVLSTKDADGVIYAEVRDDLFALGYKYEFYYTRSGKHGTYRSNEDGTKTVTLYTKERVERNKKEVEDENRKLGELQKQYGVGNGATLRGRHTKW